MCGNSHAALHPGASVSWARYPKYTPTHSRSPPCLCVFLTTLLFILGPHVSGPDAPTVTQHINVCPSPFHPHMPVFLQPFYVPLSCLFLARRPPPCWPNQTNYWYLVYVNTSTFASLPVFTSIRSSSLWCLRSLGQIRNLQYCQPIHCSPPAPLPSRSSLPRVLHHSSAFSSPSWCADPLLVGQTKQTTGILNSSRT